VVRTQGSQRENRKLFFNRNAFCKKGKLNHMKLIFFIRWRVKSFSTVRFLVETEWWNIFHSQKCFHKLLKKRQKRVWCCGAVASLRKNTGLNCLLIILFFIEEFRSNVWVGIKLDHFIAFANFDKPSKFDLKDLQAKWKTYCCSSKLKFHESLSKNIWPMFYK